MTNAQVAAIVLAAGKGTRMNSDTPKVLHEIGGKPMIQYTLDKLSQLNLDQVVIVVGYEANQVQETLGPSYTYALQQNPVSGTADAVKAGLSKVSPESKIIMVLGGDDSAFYKKETLEKFLASHLGGGRTISVITTDEPQTEKLGRIIRDPGGNFDKTLETWEYEKSGLHTDEVNCGAYLFNADWLRENIEKIDNNNDKQEYRITEALNMAHEQGEKVGLFKLEDPKEWIGVNTPEDLEKANQLINKK